MALTLKEKGRRARIRGYGLTLKEHQRLETEQNCVCAICGGNNGDKALCIDHDHKTELVRGLLCNLCNRAIGLLKDDPKILMSAIVYLNNGTPDYLKGDLILRYGQKVRFHPMPCNQLCCAQPVDK